MRQWEGIIVPFARHFYFKLGAGEHNAALYEGGSPSCSPAIRGKGAGEHDVYRGDVFFG